MPWNRGGLKFRIGFHGLWKIVIPPLQFLELFKLFAIARVSRDYPKASSLSGWVLSYWGQRVSGGGVLGDFEWAQALP